MKTLGGDSKFDKKFTMKRIQISLFLKIFIWIAIFLSFYVTGRYFFPNKIAFIGAFTTATIFISIVLINEYWLFPKYYTSNRKRYYVNNLLVSLLLVSIHIIIDRFGIPKDFEDNIKHMPLIFPIIRSFSLIMLGNFISTTILLTNTLKSNAVKEKQLKEEKLGTEIKLLKAQINPHFIFNALNNIFSLTYTKSDNAPDSVLKLSEMLRYVFYDCSNDHVKLMSEVDYISNFIAFQQMKSEHEQNINFAYHDIKEDISIAPMLFIPFIENAFKYSKIEEYTDAYVKVDLKTIGGVLNFQIVNSVPIQGKALAGNGMGIKNVKQRLEILYPDLYELEMKEDEKEYSVNLKITI